MKCSRREHEREKKKDVKTKDTKSKKKRGERCTQLENKRKNSKLGFLFVSFSFEILFGLCWRIVA
jgi:hypothetical protein